MASVSPGDQSNLMLRPPSLHDASFELSSSLGLASERAVDCLIAEDNPIASKVLETILVRLGCRCVVVNNGEDAIRCSMGEICFDVIFMDMTMPARKSSLGTLLVGVMCS
jgi:PleD family two-component response regulator